MKRTLKVGILGIMVALVLLGPFGARAEGPKNIILMIGDGMGPQAVGLMIYYNKFSGREGRRLNIERLMAMGNTGYCLTYQYETVVTDSASAATALACGVKTRDGMIGKDPEGRPLKSIIDVAKTKGKATGLISNTRITHATPAGFYASVLHRDMEDVIASQLVGEGKVDVALSSGAQFFIPKGTKVEEHPMLKATAQAAGWGESKRNDERDLLKEALEKGYQIVASREDLQSLGRRKDRKVLGLFGAVAFPAAIDRRPEMNTGVPRLAEMTKKALEILSSDPEGFFLMVEAGQIDWAEHANDVASVLHEMLEMDEALGVVLDFAQKDPSTLVIVTADHDTGGLAMAYNSYKPPKPVGLASGEVWKTKFNFNDGSIFEKIMSQKKSFYRIIMDSKGDPIKLINELETHTPYRISQEQAKEILAKDQEMGYPVPCDQKHFYVYGSMSPSAKLGRMVGKEVGVAWAAGTHTHTPVMIMAKGPWADRFRGLLDNTQVALIMAKAWGARLPAYK